MKRVLVVATTEFLAIVRTKGFIIAMMVPPLVYLAVIMVFPRLADNRVPAVAGRLAVIDPTGQVTEGVRRYLDPQAIAARRDEAFNRVLESNPMAGAGAGGAMARRAVLGETPDIQVADAGAAIVPASPGFYHRPASIADLVDQVVQKVLDRAGVPADLIARWKAPERPPAARVRRARRSGPAGGEGPA